MAWCVAGYVLVIVSCGFVGQYFYARLCKRILYIQQLQRGLLALSAEIGYCVQPLPQALKHSSRQASGEIGAFLFEVGEGLEQNFGGSAEEIWRERAQALCSRIWLAEADKALIDELSLGLGLSDSADQLKRLEFYRERLHALERDACEEKEKLGRVYRVLGWGGGLMIAMLL